MFKIPEILFAKVGENLETTNCLYPYVIREVKGSFLVSYTDFKEPETPKLPKEFKNLEEAKSWISRVHYPAQISKILTKVEV